MKMWQLIYNDPDEGEVKTIGFYKNKQQAIIEILYSIAEGGWTDEDYGITEVVCEDYKKADFPSIEELKNISTDAWDKCWKSCLNKIEILMNEYPESFPEKFKQEMILEKI